MSEKRLRGKELLLVGKKDSMMVTRTVNIRFHKDMDRYLTVGEYEGDCNC